MSPHSWTADYSLVNRDLAENEVFRQFGGVEPVLALGPNRSNLIDISLHRCIIAYAYLPEQRAVWVRIWSNICEVLVRIWAFLVTITDSCDILMLSPGEVLRRHTRLTNEESPSKYAATK